MNNQDMNRLVMLFAVAVLAGCTAKRTESTSAAKIDSVEVFAVKKELVAKTLSLPAELLPWERAALYAKIEGYVKELKVDMGSRVKRNEILVVIDAPEVVANSARSSADLQAAFSRYHTSRDTYKRMGNAAKEKGAVSDSELESARNQMLADSATYEAAKAETRALQQLKNYLVIRAPFDGVITQRNVDQGSFVGKSSLPMLILENPEKLRLRAGIPEMYTSAIPASRPSSFSVDAQPSKTYTAVLARKSNQIDFKTRTELWEFEVVNTSGELKSGMYANISFKVNRKDSSFVIPYSALVTNLERRFVIRVRDGKTEWINVRIGIGMSDKIEIFADLNEGDQLVLRANDELKEGKRVVPR